MKDKGVAVKQQTNGYAWSEDHTRNGLPTSRILCLAPWRLQLGTQPPEHAESSNLVSIVPEGPDTRIPGRFPSPAPVWG